jgi:hypothetical protein
MHGDDDGFSHVPGQAPDELQDLDLVAGIKERGRLIEEENVGLLGQRSGDEDEPPLALTEL